MILLLSRRQLRFGPPALLFIQRNLKALFPALCVRQVESCELCYAVRRLYHERHPGTLQTGNKFPDRFVEKCVFRNPSAPFRVRQHIGFLFSLKMKLQIVHIAVCTAPVIYLKSNLIKGISLFCQNAWFLPF